MGGLKEEGGVAELELELELEPPEKGPNPKFLKNSNMGFCSCSNILSVGPKLLVEPVVPSGPKLRTELVVPSGPMRI